MARRRKKLILEDPNLDITPMIDIVFNLLIFFMCATKFKTTEGFIMCFLPKNRGQGSGTPTIDLNEVRIKLLWYGDDGKPTNGDAGYVVVKIGDENYNDPGHFERDLRSTVPEKSPVWTAIHDKLNAFKAGYKGKSDKGLPVIIDARKQVPTKYIVSVLNEVVRAGIQDVTFAAPEIEY
ncbi:MAG: biopolymer transporter ExbD [Planctomycetes bacterium]|nr:biopolymer transporter ExbD [Planctomycetota bacterium]MCW8138273.1 biopolymer transporter ExbD [Planctomycetota bacterium]